MRRVLGVFILAALGTFSIQTGVARAQAEVAVDLLEFPSWLDAAGTLRIGLRLTNSGDEPASNVRISINFHEGVDTRSQLERAFQGRFGSVVGGDTLSVAEEIPPRTSRDVFVEKPLNEISFFRSSPADRAYPVRITVRSGRVSSQPVDTFMIFASSPALEPLQLVLVVPLHHRAIYSPDLTMSERVDEFLDSMEKGRIATLIDVLESYPDLPITLAPTGLLLDMLADVTEGYEVRTRGTVRTVARGDPPAVNAGLMIDRLKRIAARPLTRVISSPYSAGVLPALGQRFAAFRASAQVGATRSLIERVIEAQPLDRWVFPIPPVLDEPTLSVLQQSGGSISVILSPESLRLDQTTLTRPAPARVATRAGDSGLLIIDSGISTRLAPTDLDAIQARQQFLAETFTIYLERPAQKRTVAAAAPLDWSPDETTFRGMVEAMLGSPWLRGAGPDQAIPDLSTAQTVQLAPSDAYLDEYNLPSPEYFANLRAARRALDDFSEVSPPEEMLMALEKRILIAEGSEWWSSRRNLEVGRSFATAVIEEVNREFSKVMAPSPLTITLTSRNGVIPLSITSRADYPIDVVLKLTSSQLQFPETVSCPGSSGSSTGGCISLKRLQPRSQTVEVLTIAEGTGTFPVRVTILTPRSNIELDSTRLLVRSTAYNVVGTGITVGAGLFLAAWLIASIFRRRTPHE